MPVKQKKSQAAKQRWKKSHDFRDFPESSAADSVSAKTNADSVKQAGQHFPAHVQHVSYADAVKSGLQNEFDEHQVNHRDQHEVSSAPHVGYADFVKRGRHSDVAGPSHVETRHILNMETPDSNSQCTCNSFIFLAFLHENETMTTADLNLVLDKGDVMYKEAKKRFPKSIHLATDELPDKVDARRSMYHVDMTQLSRYGTFEEPPEEAVDTFLSFEAGLSCLLSDVQYALRIMSGLCIAVFRSTSGKYGFFDPHSRTASGLPLPLRSHNRGTARLQDSYAVTEISPSCTYELKPVEFYSMSTVNLSDNTVCRPAAKED
ncbi:paroxysmal nonkinesiogenic dyskinesia protein [Sarotherodon galilaeus]